MVRELSRTIEKTDSTKFRKTTFVSVDYRTVANGGEHGSGGGSVTAKQTLYSQCRVVTRNPANLGVLRFGPGRYYAPFGSLAIIAEIGISDFMSAFAVAIGGKADITNSSRHVYF